MRTLGQFRPTKMLRGSVRGGWPRPSFEYIAFAVSPGSAHRGRGPSSRMTDRAGADRAVLRGERAGDAADHLTWHAAALVTEWPKSCASSLVMGARP